MALSPPEGFRVRPATVEDAPAINELVIAVDTAVQGWSDSTEAELVDWWRLTELAGNSWVVEDDTLAAYGVVITHGESVETDGFVHPSKTRLGLGSWLLRRAEERARELGFAAMLTWSLAPDEDARELFERFGYREVSTFAPGDGPAFHAALDAAFADEWNFVSEPYEHWAERRMNVPDFDPTLWFIVRQGDEIAAVLRCDAERAGAGWIGALGVLGPWRKRGLGLALLRHAFGEFYRRGQRRVGLGVDAENPTGATRLYERAGMHIAYEAVAFRKELT
jgi:GNAT superfamily N-acetyltransferase